MYFLLSCSICCSVFREYQDLPKKKFGAWEASGICDGTTLTWTLRHVDKEGTIAQFTVNENPSSRPCPVFSITTKIPSTPMIGLLPCPVIGLMNTLDDTPPLFVMTQIKFIMYQLSQNTYKFIYDDCSSVPTHSKNLKFIFPIADGKNRTFSISMKGFQTAYKYVKKWQKKNTRLEKSDYGDLGWYF